MKIKKLLGLQVKGDYCFYNINKESIILVGVKDIFDKKIKTIPEKIGKYTVCGIDALVGSGRLGTAFAKLSPKERERIKKKLSRFTSVNDISLYMFPSSVEYISYRSYETSQTIEIPKKIRYIESLKIGEMGKTLLLPNSLLYFGHLEGASKLHYVKFYGETSDDEPRNSIGVYLGREESDEAHFGDSAFFEKENILEMEVGKSIQKLKRTSVPRNKYYSQIDSRLYSIYSCEENAYVTSTNLSCKLKIHEKIMLDDANFYNCSFEKIIYPDNIAESLRDTDFSVSALDELVIRDFGNLEAYLKTLGLDVSEKVQTERCLYNLIRKAKHVIFDFEPERIFSKLFMNCCELSRISTPGNPANVGEFKLGNKCRSIGKMAFLGCKKMRSVEFGRSLEEIDNSAFIGVDLSSLSLPNTLKRIGEYAFKASGISKLKLPVGIESIGKGAFDSCPNLTLSLENRDALKNYPEIYDEMMREETAVVKKYLEEGDELIKKQLKSSRYDAYKCYKSALLKSPNDASVMQRIVDILLDDRVASCISYEEILNLKDYLNKSNSKENITYLDDTIGKLIKKSNDIKKSKTINGWRYAYSYICDLEAAVKLSEYLIGMIEKHPNITLNAKTILKRILTYLTNTKTYGNDKKLLERLRELSFEVRRKLGEYIITEPLCVGRDLQSYNIISYARDAMSSNNIYGEAGYYDAEMWVEIAKALNAKVEVPKELLEYRKKKKENKGKVSSVTKENTTVTDLFGTPIFGGQEGGLLYEYTGINYAKLFKEAEARNATESSSYTPGYDSNPDADEVVSEYWRKRAEEAERAVNGGFTAKDIEDDWSILNDQGFWSDTSWQ